MVIGTLYDLVTCTVYHFKYNQEQMDSLLKLEKKKRIRGMLLLVSKKKYKKYQEINFTYPGRKDFLALFNAYKNHEIDFQKFDDAFSIISIDNFQDFFNKKEYSAVSELDDAVSWYIPDPKEQKISNFKSIDKVEESFQKVISILNI